ncbi:Ubx2 protein [Saccharomycopsis crataegensis]|uniref:Ubx2 protein n=1 Tax=Saccharomycopsis crataegensis TaxID=43959 RepID=A0AAV5QFW5_9ASCO|nr:Ubx2 protein [Saccharomycopsis crataegensis]
MSSELTPHQTQKLQDFKEITQYNDDDHQKMLTLLENCQWNIEAAIQRFFDNNFDFPHLEPSTEPLPLPTPPPPPPLPPPHSSTNNNNNNASTTNFDSFNLTQFDLMPKFPKANNLSGNWKLTPGIKLSRKDDSLWSDTSSPLLFILLVIPKTLLFVILKLAELLKFLIPGLFNLWKPNLNQFPASPTYLPQPPNTKEEAAAAAGGDTSSQLTIYKDFNFKSYFQQVIKDASDLPIFDGEFNAAYDVCKQELKFLIIILINTENKATSEIFLKSVVNSSEFASFINNKYADRSDNFIIWGGDVNHLEGWLVGRQYRARNVPYIAMVSNVSTYGETFPTMSLMKYSQNFEVSNNDAATASENLGKLKAKSKKIIKLFQRTANNYVIQLINQKIERDSQNYERLLKQQQDEAYLKSLHQDKLKKQQRDAEQLKINNKKQEVLDEIIENDKHLQFLKQQFVKWQTVLVNNDRTSDPIDLFTNQPMTDKKQYTTIQFKLPNGQRFVKKFNRDQPMKDIYLFVQLKLVLLSLLETEKFDTEGEVFEYLKTSKIAGSITSDDMYYETVIFRFELNSSFPRFKVAMKEHQPIHGNKDLVPNCNILVEFDLDYQEQLDFLVENFVVDDSKKPICEMTIEDIADEMIEESSDEE